LDQSKVINDPKLQSALDAFTARVVAGMDENKREMFNFKVYPYADGSVNGKDF